MTTSMTGDGGAKTRGHASLALLKIPMLGAGLLAGVLAPLPAQAGDVKITVSLSVLRHEAAPIVTDINEALSYTIALTGKNSAHYTCSDGCNYDITLGKPKVTGESSVTYNARNGVFFINLTTPSYTAVTRITTDGVSSCTAVVQTRRRPGHQYFEFYQKGTHEKMFVSEWRVTVNSCTITSA